jgi:hypothetical protein
MAKGQAKIAYAKEHRIQEIADFLFENPGADRGNVIAKFAKKWQTATRTLDRYYADARKIAKLRILKASKARDEVLEAEAKNGSLVLLKTRMDYFAELEKIAFGMSEKKGDRVRALWILIKGLGYDFKSEILKEYV